jgi:hypothetical protein
MLDDIKMSSNQPKLVKSVPNIPQTTARTVSTEGRIESSQGQVIKLPERKKRKPIPTWVVILVTIIIILLIIIYAAYLSSKALQAQSTLVVQAFPDLIVLDDLLDLQPSGTCCNLVNNGGLTSQFVYDSTTGYTYSTTATTTINVCAGLTGTPLSNCVSYVNGTGSTPQILAHYGIKTYYAFSVGTPGNVCSSFSACPNI